MIWATVDLLENKELLKPSAGTLISLVLWGQNSTDINVNTTDEGEKQ